MPKVSILTPTYDREPTVTALLKWLQKQTHPDWEWWLFHDGPAPYGQAFQEAAAADPRVKYVYSAERRSIGAKTNDMLARATGEVIMHVDDDDYYAPTYLETMIAALEGRDFVKLSGWYVYKMEANFLAYWNLSFLAPYHFRLAANEPVSLFSTRIFHERVAEEFEWGYGFSYAYRSRVRDIARLNDAFCHNAENDLMHAVRSHPECRSAHFADKKGVVLHVIHDGNASLCLPQQQLPAVLLPEIFGPDVIAHLDAVRQIMQAQAPSPARPAG